MSQRLDDQSQRLNDVGETFQELDQTGSTEETGMTRRSAISQIAVMGSAGLVAVSGLPAQLPASTRYAEFSAQNFSLADWEALIGEKFSVRDWPGNETQVPESTWFTLEEVMEHRTKAPDSDRPASLRPRALSLLFSSNKDIESATYHLVNANVGRNDLFVHPVPRDDRKHQKIYEVVLN
jgi:hypothetical protein